VLRCRARSASALGPCVHARQSKEASTQPPAAACRRRWHSSMPPPPDATLCGSAAWRSRLWTIYIRPAHTNDAVNEAGDCSPLEPRGLQLRVVHRVKMGPEAAQRRLGAVRAMTQPEVGLVADMGRVVWRDAVGELLVSEHHVAWLQVHLHRAVATVCASQRRPERAPPRLRVVVRPVARKGAALVSFPRGLDRGVNGGVRATPHRQIAAMVLRRACDKKRGIGFVRVLRGGQREAVAMALRRAKKREDRMKAGGRHVRVGEQHWAG